VGQGAGSSNTRGCAALHEGLVASERHGCSACRGEGDTHALSAAAAAHVQPDCNHARRPKRAWAATR